MDKNKEEFIKSLKNGIKCEKTFEPNSFNVMLKVQMDISLEQLQDISTLFTEDEACRLVGRAISESI